MLCGFLNKAFAQVPDNISEKAKIRYINKLNKKNERYLKQEEKNTKKLFQKMSKSEKEIMKASNADSTLTANSFSDIESKLEKGYHTASNFNSADVKSTLTSASLNLESGIKDYLKQQITSIAFLSDSAKSKSQKLKSKSDKALTKLNATSEKLNKLKSAQSEIKKRQDVLKVYGVSNPLCSGPLKDLEKNAFYFNQRMDGFQSLYTTPSLGIEKNMSNLLNNNLNFQSFSSQLNLGGLPVLNQLPGTTVDLSGYQTKATVQAQMPQNTSGISEIAQQALMSNLNSSLQEFDKLKNKLPDVSAFKEKPSFKTNPYKSLPLRLRLKPGFNMSTLPKTITAPLYIALAGSLGYKWRPRLTPIIGASYHIGIANNVYNLALTNQGFSARGGVEYKLIYGFSIQCTYQQTWIINQKPSKESGNYTVQPALIAGLIFKQKISQKHYSTMMVGYDFFHNKHQPVTTPLIVRIGWE